MALEPSAPCAPNHDEAVRARYAAAATRREPALCCPVSYEPRYLEAIPPEVLERDYGCGDPSRYVREGDLVLDLGSGSGKVCFIAAQIAGPKGAVIGVDENPAMLELARRAALRVAERVGYENVRFLRGRIQDLALDPDRLDAWLRSHPVRSAEDLRRLEREAERLRREQPLIADASVDLVVSNCVLNLVAEDRKPALFAELSRVLRPGGRIAISDIVSDEPVPAHLKADPELWSGCVGGALPERELLAALERAGFWGLEIAHWSEEPFAVVEGIEFRSVTLTGRKGDRGPCLEGNHAVVYRGPWHRVEDDDGHVLVRGERAAVCAKTYGVLTSEPYARHVVAVPPRTPVSEPAREPFDCARTQPRHPRETKGLGYAEARRPGACAGPACC
jgi:ubiquinone/menaquinone biosynthesis C-methylase UbiE